MVSLFDLRLILRASGRNAGTETYPQVNQDLALKTALDTFLLETKLNKATFSLPLSSGVASYDVSDVQSDFSSERLHRVEVGYDNVAIRDYAYVAGYLADSTRQAQPVVCGYSTPTTVHFYPIPESGYNATITWVPVITDWDAGISDSDSRSITINLQADAAREVARTGAVAYLQQDSPEHFSFSNVRMGEFRQVISRYKGTVGVSNSVRIIKPALGRGTGTGYDLPGWPANV
jgi:hypothetical protein